MADRAPGWNGSELAAIAAAEEVQVSSVRRDGSWSSQRIVWLVRHGDELYIRSVNGADAAWFRATQVSHAGRVDAAGIVREVAYLGAEHALDDALDSAYRSKYRRYAAAILDHITSESARSTTVRLVPR